MSKYFLLPEKGNFYKANLHTHTTLSDGRLTPEQMKAAYKKEGYSVVAFTDHNNYVHHTELDDPDFLTLAAFEGDITEPLDDPSNWSPAKCYHFNFFDCTPGENMETKLAMYPLPQRYHDTQFINEYLGKMKRLGFIISYNHPYWSCQNYDDYKALRNCFAMEIYNHGCEVEGMYGYNPQSYDEMLRTGNRLFCLATDDNHNVAPFGDVYCDSFGGFVQIKAEALTYSAVIDALKAGNFYSSRGPAINELYIEDGKLHIACSNVKSIYVATEGKNGHIKHAQAGETLNGAEFTLKGNEGYIRVTCRDENGKDACSNAYFLDKLLFK